ncbi:YhfT family protein [Streptobacillus felis]|uniref:YhfT family protein n=1 Tax=Streptobacillus felis TaxID=1384509 RepID=A0A7Z0TBX7_9FUSO|nr:YhfT family protein [Streptobacillus felis]NYV27833.1 YhfT family protein [Streptobacillus felis]
MFIKIIVIAMLAGLASILANQGIAVFNDGLRPLIPENLEGRMDRKSLSATSFALSFGLVIGFGIPFSIGKTIILIHSILLGTDIIGTAFSRDKKGMVLSGGAGAAYGVGLVLGLQAVVDLFAKLPVNFLPNLSAIGSPIIVAFAVFPVLVIGYQYGVKKGALSLMIVLIARQLVSVFGKFAVGSATISLNADGIALLVGIIVMLFFAINDKTESTNSNATLIGIFSERVAKVKKNILILSLMGGLVSAAVSLGMLAGDPISLNLIAEGQKFDAGIVALARTIGFIPLVATTAITTGVYGPTGLTFVFAIGIFVSNPIVAFVLGAATLGLEIILLEQIAKLLDKFPGIKACGDQIRTSMTKVLEVALLVGAMVACNNMAGNNGLGYLFVIGVYLLNRASKKPLVDMAVGPIATILFGIILNILFLVKLFVPVVAG